MMRKNKGFVPIFLGLLLIAAALLLTAYNLYDSRRAEDTARQVVARLEERLPAESLPAETQPQPEKETAPVSEVEIPDYVLNPEMEMPEETIEGRAYIGILRIPALELELPVLSGWSYPGLKIAPCRYSGSAYTGDLILCAHNYSSHFGRLKSLRPGDEITFTDVDGNCFSYQVAELETLEPTAIEEMESGDWDLTLFTCTVGGKTRVTLRCEAAED